MVWWRRGESNSCPTGASLKGATSVVFDLNFGPATPKDRIRVSYLSLKSRISGRQSSRNSSRLCDGLTIPDGRSFVDRRHYLSSECVIVVDCYCFGPGLTRLSHPRLAPFDPPTCCRNHTPPMGVSQRRIDSAYSSRPLLRTARSISLAASFAAAVSRLSWSCLPLAMPNSTFASLPSFR